MSSKRMNHITAAFLCIILVLMAFPVTVQADTGPKPSVCIQFENMEDKLCYGTLLSKNDSTGPYSVWDGDEDSIYNYELDMDIWKAFVEYEDTDGYNFLQIAWKVSETKEIDWNYYPPDSFKILLYYPETGKFIESNIYERYAFDSYYTVDMNDTNMSASDSDQSDSADTIYAYRSYNYQVEILSLIVRIVITILIEMMIALLFGFRKKKQLALLAAVNVTTQVILNFLLNIINYKSGESAFTLYYVLLEVLVFVMEAVIYCSFMNRLTDNQKKKWVYIAYSLVANTVSFGAGMLIAQVLPGIF